MNILEQHGIDPEKFYLGRLCKHGHDWRGTGSNLRRINGRACEGCVKVRSKDKWEKLKSDPEALHNLNAWRRQYDQKRMSDPEHVARKRLQKAEYREKNRDRIKQRQKAWSDRNPDKVKASAKRTRQKHREEINRRQREFRQRHPEVTREYTRRYRVKNLERCREWSKLWHRNQIKCPEVKNEINARRRFNYAKNPELYREYARRYVKRNLDSARQRNRLRRIRRRSVVSLSYTTKQLLSRQAEFEGYCAYCCDRAVAHWDHFIAISRGGSDVIGNLIPACQFCNSSKQASDPLEWYKRQPFYSDRQWRKILKVLGKTPDNYNQIPLL